MQLAQEPELRVATQPSLTRGRAHLDIHLHVTTVAVEDTVGEEEVELEGEEEEVELEVVEDMVEEEDMGVDQVEAMGETMEEEAKGTHGIGLITTADLGAHPALLEPHLHPTTLIRRITTPLPHTADTAVTETRVG